MTDFDLERLGDVWRQRPDPKELEELRRTAEAVRRRARWSQLIDSAAAALVAGVVTTLVIANPELDTFLVGAAAILILIASHYRQRRMRQEELKSLTGTAEEMLDQSIARVQSTLRRARYQLLAIVPGLLIGLAVAGVADRGSSAQILSRLVAEPWLGFALAGGAVLAVAGVTVHFLGAMRRNRAELERLITLREAYRRERESSSE